MMYECKKPGFRRALLFFCSSFPNPDVYKRQASCYLTMDFKSQESRFLSIMNASESLYILKVVAIEQDVEHFTFAFPMETLQTIYEASKNPHSEKLTMEFYASGDPTSVTDRFYIAIDQFAKYFEDTNFS